VSAARHCCPNIAIRWLNLGRGVPILSRDMRFHVPLSIALLLGVLNCFGAGRQLTGVYTPTQTPAQPPSEAQKKFTVPPGFEVRLFAAEPDVINPVAMTWDERGRLWVVELYEYPLGAPKGQKPRDRVKILEDTDGDGRADKVTVFVDGLNLATGIQIGNNGVYVGQAPDLLFFQDTDGDDVADKRTVVKTGFGLDDRHELLNGFTWGPDGWLYMTEGVFTHSKVKDPDNPDDPAITVDAAVARYHPRTKKFEVFADGTSNPWGVDFDRTGNAFVSACVIDHFFHMAPGGHYVRQGGSPANPYAYYLLPSIVDHKHFRAAFAGVNIYQGSQYPAEWLGTAFMGNIHQSAINHDKLTPKGSSFASTADKDFLTSADGWFRPVSTQTGPDGALWIMDWYDKYPCYQNANADPEGVDREHGRIWRVVFTGGKTDVGVPPRPAGMDLGRLSSVELVDVLANPNVWQRRTAQRLLTERRDPSSKTPLLKLLTNGKTVEGRLGALWSLHGAELLDDGILDKYADDKEAAIRTWVARLTGERQDGTKKALARLAALAGDDDPYVRTAVATATRQFVSGNLTVDTAPSTKTAQADVFPIMRELLQNPSTTNDQLYDHIVWMSVEPKIAQDPKPLFAILADKKTPLSSASSTLLRRSMRRIVDTKDGEKLNAAVAFLATLEEKNPPLVSAALDGLIDAQKGKPTVPEMATGPILAKLSNSKTPGVPEKAQRLGALWGDATAAKAALARINDPAASDDERLRGIQTARELKEESSREALLKVVNAEAKETLVNESIRALGEVGGDDVGDALLARWARLSPTSRRLAAEVLVSRKPWAKALLTAVENKQVAPSDISATALRALSQNNDASIRQRAAKSIGRFRATDADKLKLIAEKKKIVLAGAADFEAGHAVALKTCLVCHKLHGEGADVGPDLTGVGRSTLDALLANVIDPNQVVGKGYENTEIETKDGRTVNGRIVEDTDTRLRLLAAGPKEEIVAKSDIAAMKTSELSLMPEGLEQMPDTDFRNLIWYILNPPQDNRPMTPALRRELIGDDATAQKSEGKKPSASAEPIDRESVALWNPEWWIICPDFEGAPAKLTEYGGRRNVLKTHPISRKEACALERSVELPKSKKAVLSFYAAADERGDWELRVVADGKVLDKEIISHDGDRWKQIRVDLSSYAGKTVKLRLENAANDWNYEFGFWSDVQISEAEEKTASVK